MAFKRTHDIAVKTSSYTGNDGKTKNKYENIGYVLTKDDGGKMYFLNRTFNPAGIPVHEGNAETVLLSIFEVKQKSAMNESDFPEEPAAPVKPSKPVDDFIQNGIPVF